MSDGEAETTAFKYSATTATVDEKNAVDSLLQSCSSIQKRTRSCLTLSSTTTSKNRTTKRKHDSNISGDDHLKRIREEEWIDAELERKIVEYRTAILRLKRQRDVSPQQEQEERTTNTIKAANKVATQQLRQIKSQLMDETTRQQQEQLLLHRLAMFQPAIDVAYYHDHDLRNKTEDNEEYSSERARTILIQEAVQCRNKEAKRVLETQRRLEDVKRQLTSESEKGQQLQRQNRALWKELQSAKAQQNKDMDNGSTNDNSNSEEQHCLATENLILKRALADLISGSGIGWYNDEQLRETFLQLEH